MFNSVTYLLKTIITSVKTKGCPPNGQHFGNFKLIILPYSTVTDLARFLGLSGSKPRCIEQ